MGYHDDADKVIEALKADQAGSGWRNLLEGLLPAIATQIDTPGLGVSTPLADGAADMTKTLFLLGSGIDLTGFTPTRAGQWAIIICTASGTDPTVTCGAGVTLNAAGHTVMTFPDADDAMILIAESTTRWFIISNIGTVTVA